MDMKSIDADAIKISLEIGLFILILWVLSHIIPIAVPIASAVNGNIDIAGDNVTAPDDIL